MFLLLTRYHYWLDNIRDNRNMCDLYIYIINGVDPVACEPTRGVSMKWVSKHL